MRDRTRFALKQAATIFLLITTLVLRVVPEELLAAPRALLMDGVCTAASPLYFLSGLVFETPAALFWRGKSREALELEVMKLTAQLAARDDELRRAREELAAVRGFETLPLADNFFAWSGRLQGFIRGADTSVFSRSYVVNLGTREGVVKGFPVVWGRYAVGVVSETGAHYSRVRVLSDPSSRVAVRFAGSRHQGVLVGGASQTCPVKFVSNRVEDGEIRAGEMVMTSGADLVFPPNLVVGRVVRFWRQPSKPSAAVEVELAVDFSRIESCVVLKRKSAIGEE